MRRRDGLGCERVAILIQMSQVERLLNQLMSRDDFRLLSQLVIRTLSKIVLVLVGHILGAKLIGTLRSNDRSHAMSYSGLVNLPLHGEVVLSTFVDVQVGICWLRPLRTSRLH